MSASSLSQFAPVRFDSAMPSVDAEHIASSLCTSLGAWGAYLAVFGREGEQLHLAAVSAHTHLLPDWQALGGGVLLRRAMATQESMIVHAADWPALALPILVQDRIIGGALLLYDALDSIDTARGEAAAHLAGVAFDAARQVAELHEQAEEIEERTRLREIQNSRNLIRGVIDSVPMGLALIGGDGTILAANRTLSNLFGFEPAALVGMAYNKSLGPWTDSPASQTFNSGQVEHVRRTLHKQGGAQVLQEITSFPLRDSGGRPHQVVEVWEDITERVALQTQLVRAEKLAAIGQLAASIAHEVGNPLQAIQGFLSLFLEQCPPDIPNERFLKLAEEEIERIVQVLARLRDLYRPRADVFTAVDVNELLESVLLLTGKQLERSRVRVLRELQYNLSPIFAVADQLKQVLLNLVLNAIDAMSSHGGLLHIQTYTVHAEKRSIAITLTDTGQGIAADQLPHIFDGLHTTKERGMGLGLYTSKAIIERHMGRITVQSQVGEGTTFTIILPIADEETTL